MTKKIIFDHSFLVSGIMCYEGCGNTVRNCLENAFDDIKKKYQFPNNAQLTIDAEPASLGIHRLFVTIAIDEPLPPLNINPHDIANHFQNELDEWGFNLITHEEQEDSSSKVNWINIVLNLIALSSIVILSLTFAPSLPLTLSLIAITFLTTAITSRQYLSGFFRNFRQNSFANMNSSITFGWFLSLVHTLYHTITMPMVMTFSMTFMNFCMPIMLITIVNGMDEIKRLVLRKSNAMHLKNIKSLFPEMTDNYECFNLDNLAEVEQFITSKQGNLTAADEDLLSAWINSATYSQRKNLLRKGMLIKIKQGDCFPVDGIIVQGNTCVDSSLLTGEPQQSKSTWDRVPAGAINLSNDIVLYAEENAYSSTINKLLFSANRASDEKKAAESRNRKKFLYLYIALIALAMTASILIPVVLGTFTVSLLIVNITGILFAICPCTMAIAHELPILLSIFQRNKNGINLRKDESTDTTEDVDTVVFDKTGTLTTGQSSVDSSEGISRALWQKIYLLEREQGRGHPLARAITQHYETKLRKNSLIQDIRQIEHDSENRGLQGIVQGKKIQIGSLDYLERAGINYPDNLTSLISAKLKLGYTPVYIAEDNQYQGFILIKHEIRETILADLMRLKKEGKKIIMLTGDTEASANGFNEQLGGLFEPNDIHAHQSPTDKEKFLKEIMTTHSKPQGIWFVGDGLNDAPCARLVSEKGGMSCAMNANDKAAFFTDISLNGSLTYLFKHTHLNRALKKSVFQNQLILIYSALIYLSCMLTFSVTGVVALPIIPLVIMASTTLLVLFNSYRTKISVDNALNKSSSWFKQLLGSDATLVLLVGISALLILSLLFATVVTSGLALPVLTLMTTVLSGPSGLILCAVGGLCGITAGFLATFYFQKNQHTDELVPAKTDSLIPLDEKTSPQEHYTHSLFQLKTNELEVEPSIVNSRLVYN